MNVPRWWRSRSQAARFDFYVRVSYYANFILFPPWAAGAVDADLGGAAPWVPGRSPASTRARACCWYAPGWHTRPDGVPGPTP